MGLFLRAPGMTALLCSLEWELDWGGLSVLPKVGLQRAADLLLGANMHNSQISGRVPSSYLPFIT